MRTKDLPVLSVKAGPDDGLLEGQFSAYASVFGNVDSYGDIVVKGAFDADLARWEASGNPIPLLFGHNMEDPDYNIGTVISAVEDDKGLLVTAQLDLASPKAAQTYRMLKGKRVNQMSFAYDVLDESQVENDGKKANELRELRLYEVSVVTIGANQATEILAVKAARAAEALAAQADEEIPDADHMISLRKAWEALGAVLAASQGLDGETASEHVPAKDEEPLPAKSEEPSRVSSARRLSAQALFYALSERR